MSRTAKQLGVVSVLTLIGAAAVVFFYLYIQQQQVALREALSTIANEAAVERAFIQLSNILDATTADRAELSTYIIDGQAGAIRFLEEIEAIALQYQVDITGTTLTTEIDEQFGSKILELQFFFAGPTPSTRQYLTLLETLPYASYLDTLTVSERTSEQGVGTLSGEVVLRVAIDNIEL